MTRTGILIAVLCIGASGAWSVERLVTLSRSRPRVAVLEARLAAEEAAVADAAGEAFGEILRTIGKTALPFSGADAVPLLRGMAAKVRVDIASVRPGQERKDEDAFVVPVRVSVKGKAHAVGRFLSLLEKADRVSRVRSLALKGAPGSLACEMSVEFAVAASSSATERRDVSLPDLRSVAGSLAFDYGFPAGDPFRESPSAPAPRSPDRVAPPTIVLSGVVLDGENSKAIVKRQGEEKSVFLRVGESLDGHRVLSIEDGCIVVEKSGHRFKIMQGRWQTIDE